MERELVIGVGSGCLVAAFEGVLHRGPEGLAVELEYVCASNLAPERNPLVVVRPDVESAVEEGQTLVDLKAADGELGGAAKPRQRAFSQLYQLLLASDPHQISLIRPNGLRIVMRQERRVLIAPLTHALKPARKCAVQPRPPRPGQAGVRNLARHSVLDGVFAIARKGGAGPAPDEVAVLEYPQVRPRTPDQLIDGPGPEDSADHRSSLERLLLLGIQEIDARRHDGLHGVRDREVSG